MIRMPVGTFELVEDNRNGWNQEAFKERYSDILDKYDFIVGDWGYGQLRLRGFYDSSNRKAPFEQKIATLDEYLHEFCNFGCAYFVLRRVRGEELEGMEGDTHAVTPMQPQGGERREQEYQPRGKSRSGREFERTQQRPSRHARSKAEHRERSSERNGNERGVREPRGRRATAVEMKKESDQK